MKDLLTIKEASIWASDYLGRNVTPSNISYLIQYGRIAKTKINGGILVTQNDLASYYQEHHQSREERWTQKLGDDLNWNLSFSEYKESETTKHVHRIHPYKGKFIPQLVEYFLDSHTDEFKRETYFQSGDIVLDPFCGSGTTLVQSNELGIHSVGIDVSAFNAFIGNVKVGDFDVAEAKTKAREITAKLSEFQQNNDNKNFEFELMNELKRFNNDFFPSPDFRYKVRQNEIDEKQYSAKKVAQFSVIYKRLATKYKIELKQSGNDTFLDNWFLKPVRDEIDFIFNEIQPVRNKQTKKLLAMVLSRTMRSCRATTHADLGTLKEPVTETYYCRKHGKICKPVFSVSNWWQRYAQDTIKRIEQFDAIKTDTMQQCVVGDGRTIDIVKSLQKKYPELAQKVSTQKIDGIFSSPPYVGLIDYHEQHAYAYDLFGFERNDELEIGSIGAGHGRNAQKLYVAGIVDVLNNCKQYLKPDYNVFLVANDKNGLYPKIASDANMKIVNEHKRPVLNRTEKSRSAYSEIIFHLKAK